MQKEKEELKNIFMKAMDKALDIDISDYIEFDDDDENFIDAECTADIIIDGHNVAFFLSKIIVNTATFMGGKYKLTLCFGNCNDVAGANTELNIYDESEIGNVFYCENAIEETSDSLLLSAEFDADSEERATEVLTNILSYLADEEKSKPLFELLKYFD